MPVVVPTGPTQVTLECLYGAILFFIIESYHHRRSSKRNEAVTNLRLSEKTLYIEPLEPLGSPGIASNSTAF